MAYQTSFNSVRFQDFHYRSYSPKYWLFTSQVNDTETKILVSVAADHVFHYQDRKGNTNYVLKVDQTHCAFFKQWEYFTGKYGNYLLLDKKRYRVVPSNRKFLEMNPYGKMLSFRSALLFAKEQERNRRKKKKAIMIRKD